MSKDTVERQKAKAARQIEYAKTQPPKLPHCGHTFWSPVVSKGVLLKLQEIELIVSQSYNRPNNPTPRQREGER